MHCKKKSPKQAKYINIIITLSILSLNLPACEKSGISRRTVKKLSDEFERELELELETDQESSAGDADIMRLSAKKERKPAPLELNDLATNSMYFYSAGRVTGNMGGRFGANKLCVKRFKALPSGFLSVAFLTVSEKDRLDQLPLTASVPIDLPIKSLHSGDLIAKRWYDLFANPQSKAQPKLEKSLLAAGVYIDGANRFERYEGLFWSGGWQRASDDKSFHHCKHWTSDTGWGFVGGNHAISHPQHQKQPDIAWRYPWYDYQMILPCQTPQALLCLLYPNKAHH
ncbi:MAG: hypothetical protein ACOH5I_10650 [Oligoflexus sp.]